MTSRKTSLPKGPKAKKEAAVDPGLHIPPILPKTTDDKRAAAREAATRLARMTPEEQAAALFHSLGVQRKV